MSAHSGSDFSRDSGECAGGAVRAKKTATLGPPLVELTSRLLGWLDIQERESARDADAGARFQGQWLQANVFRAAADQGFSTQAKANCCREFTTNVFTAECFGTGAYVCGGGDNGEGELLILLETQVEAERDAGFANVFLNFAAFGVDAFDVSRGADKQVHSGAGDHRAGEYANFKPTLGMNCADRYG